MCISTSHKGLKKTAMDRDQKTSQSLYQNQLYMNRRTLNSPVRERIGDQRPSLPDFFSMVSAGRVQELSQLIGDGISDDNLELRLCAKSASLSLDAENRVPIFLTDVQDFLMAAILRGNTPYPSSRWFKLDNPHKLKQSVVVIAQGYTLRHFLIYQARFEKSKRIFDKRFELILPAGKEAKLIEELAQVIMRHFQTASLIDQYGSLQNAIQMNSDPTLYLRAIFPIDHKATKCQKQLNATCEDKFPRSKLLLCAGKMIDTNYPMPIRGALAKCYKHYVLTKSKYTRVTDHSPMFAVDCEMCKTRIGKELTRISIVNENLEVVYSQLVKPANEITDYLTNFSGITARMLLGVTKTIEEVQKDVRELLPPDAILIGQSLHFDLHAMKMMHPYVIDTAVCFNLSGHRDNKSKLKTLSRKFLKQTIQDGVKGHNPTEDARASMQLVKVKLAHNIYFGDKVMEDTRRSSDHANIESQNAFDRNKTTALISACSLDEKLKETLVKAKGHHYRLTISEVNGNEAVAKNISKHALVIANLIVTAKELKKDAVNNTVMKLDNCIATMYGKLAKNGIFLLIMGGTADDRGVAMAVVKTPHDD